MPGPKMGPRPPDFDEDLVRRSPTFRKWEELLPGATLRYACREFSKGSGDDEERLMRRIMIARRNNVRDHQALKWARRMQSTKDKETTKVAVSSSSSSQQQPRKNQKGANASRLESNRESDNSGGYNSNHSRSETEASLSRTSRLLSGEQGYSNRSRFETEAIISRTSHLLPGEQGPPSGRRSRRPTTLISDEAIKEEMDVDAVESTRSYKQWSSLPNGAQFLYNQKYIKGHEAHDWLLKKNIWRRMRYRRENKKMVEQMLSLEKGQPPTVAQQQKSRKRRHDATAVSNSVKGSTNRNPAVEGLDAIMVDAAAPTMVVSTTSTLTTEAAAAAALGTSTPNETNRQEMVASTASEIVDHALLSTNTGDGVAAPPTVNAATGETITISIGELHQQQQQLQDHHHHQHHNHHHHHDAAESATAFAASIAMAGVGMSIGTDGDLVNSNHETAVADSAAVEAAVAAALAATDVKSNAYHHHLSHSSVNHHHEGLMDANDVVLHLGSNDPPAETSTMTSDGTGSHPHSHSVQPPSAEASSPLPTEASAAGLGLALDAAAKLAAAAVTTSASDEAVLAVSEAITASANAGGVGGESDSDDDRETLII